MRRGRSRGSGSEAPEALGHRRNADQSKGVCELFFLYVEPVLPTVTQPLFHVPSPICALEGGNEEEEETQVEGGKSESMRQLDATLTPSTLLLELCLSTLFSVLIFH